MIEWFQSNYENILMVAGAVYMLATAIAAVTPSDKDNTILEKIGSIADRFGIKLKGK